MIVTLMVMMLVIALTTTMTTVTIDNLKAARSAQQVGLALNAAEAGVSRALAYLRTKGAIDKVNDCSPERGLTTPCAGFEWGFVSDKPFVPLGELAGHEFQAWIETVKPFQGHRQHGKYVIRSIGRASGEAAQAVAVNVEINDVELPKGIVADTIIGGGDHIRPKVRGMSLFSGGCIRERDKLVIDPDVKDLAYGIPASAHAASITEQNASCSTNNSIHKDADCNTDYPFDQSAEGGSLVDTECETELTDHPQYDAAMGEAWQKHYPAGSKVNPPDVFDLFDVGRDPSTELIEQLKSLAKQQSQYWTTTSYSAPAPGPEPSVMFFELATRGTVNLSSISQFTRAACIAGHSLIVVIKNGDARLNSHTEMAATLIVTDGSVTHATGTADFIGTIHADSITISGDVNLSMDQCYLNNRLAALLTFRVTNYREVEPTEAS